MNKDEFKNVMEALSLLLERRPEMTWEIVGNEVRATYRLGSWVEGLNGSTTLTLQVTDATVQMLNDARALFAPAQPAPVEAPKVRKPPKKTVPAYRKHVPSTVEGDKVRELRAVEPLKREPINGDAVIKRNVIMMLETELGRLLSSAEKRAKKDRLVEWLNSLITGEQAKAE